MLLIMSLTGGAAVGIGVVVVGRGTEVEPRLLLSALALGGFSATGLPAGMWIDRRRFVWLGAAGVLASAAGLVYSTLLIWGLPPSPAPGPPGPGEQKTAISLVVAAVTLAYLSLLALAAGRHRLVDAVVVLTAAAVVLLSILVVLSIAVDAEPRGALARALGVLSILAALGTLVAPLLGRLLAQRRGAPGRHRPGGPTPPI